MLCFYRIDVSEGTDVNKTSEPNECDICHYRHFLNKGFKFQPNVSNRYHDLLMMSMNFSDIASLNIKSADYCCIISGISRIEAIKLIQNFDLIEKTGIVENIKIYFHI